METTLFTRCYMSGFNFDHTVIQDLSMKKSNKEVKPSHLEAALNVSTLFAEVFVQFPEQVRLNKFDEMLKSNGVTCITYQTFEKGNYTAACALNRVIKASTESGFERIVIGIGNPGLLAEAGKLRESEKLEQEKKVSLEFDEKTKAVIESMSRTMVTKEDLAQVVSKDDISRMATKEDIFDSSQKSVEIMGGVCEKLDDQKAHVQHLEANDKKQKECISILNNTVRKLQAEKDKIQAEKNAMLPVDRVTKVLTKMENDYEWKARALKAEKGFKEAKDALEESEALGNLDRKRILELDEKVVHLENELKRKDQELALARQSSMGVHAEVLELVDKLCEARKKARRE